MHEKEHKRVKKSAEQGTNTPDNDMVISVPECCIVCGVTRWRVWVTFTSATVSIAVQF